MNERLALARKATRAALRMEKAMLSLIGTHRRRTYAHDIVYGTHQLYVLYGRPWNAATEGSEHEHQNMKKYFARMVNHRTKGADVLGILRLSHAYRALMQTDAVDCLPRTGYVAGRANITFAAKEGAVVKRAMVEVGGKESGAEGRERKRQMKRAGVEGVIMGESVPGNA